MKIVDIGVLESSFMDFLIPSEFAQEALFYSPQFGHFRCDEKYCIDRCSFGQFLLMYIIEGSMEVETRGRKMTAQKEQIVLIDCHEPHRYSCEQYVNFLWFHFNGNSGKKYVDYLYERFGIVFAGEHIPLLRKNFEILLSCAQKIPPKEHLISQSIHTILSALASPEQQEVNIDNLLLPALDFIHNNFAEEINLNQLASLCSISPSHFIRSFKRYIDCTPHEYLLSYRLRQAKQMLLASADTIEIIAEKCGFNSASHFARAFRKSSGLAPCEFRKMQF